MLNFLIPAWNSSNTRLLAQNAEHEALTSAIKNYFMQTDANKAEDIYKNVVERFQLNHKQDKEQSFAVKDGKILINPDLYNKILILQIANDFLDAEALAMAKICQDQGQPFICAKGCSGCCSQMILCSETESLLIALYLHNHTEQMNKFLVDFLCFDQQTKDIAKSYTRWAQAHYGEGKDDKSHRREDFHIACPFLSRDNICTIYAFRPYACRSSIAVDKKCAEFTQTTKGNIQGMHNMLFSLYTGHHTARQKLMSNFFPTEKELHKTIMPYMVHRALHMT